MATITRSSRRTEAPAVRHPLHVAAPPHLIAAVVAQNAQNLLQNHVAANRNKRQLGGPEREFGALAQKRTRFAVDYPERPHRREAPQSKATAVPLARPTTVAPPAHAVAPAATSVKAAPPPPSAAHQSITLEAQQTSRTKHQAKVINGIKHELDKLQPSGSDRREQGRKLRSQEATRFKSELSAYFPDYDEVIGNDPKEEHILNLETPIIVTDSRSDRAKTQDAIWQALPEPSGHQAHKGRVSVRGYGDALFDDLFESQRIDFAFLETSHKAKTSSDPLPDSHFEPAHKKAERLERSIRNTEKGRAQHEKDQIIRLLEGLQGHDWLRTMGVSGITESKKKSFEPARQYFIKGCRAILAKFRRWAAEEKRRKLEKEKALAEQAEVEEEDAEPEPDQEEEEAEAEDDDEAEEMVDSDDEAAGGDDEASNGDPPDYSDVDASIARQLHEEAAAQSRASGPSKPPGRKGRQTITSQPRKPAAKAKAKAPKEFKSFFRKKHEREAAITRPRRGGRRVVAWGEQIPEIPENDFVLPVKYRDEETMKSRARRQRRDRRGSKQ